MSVTGEAVKSSVSVIGSHSSASEPCLREATRKAVRRYLADMGDVEPENLYQVVLEEMERPLLEEMMRWTGNNQSRTAQILGLNRGTLRKKLARYNLL